MGKKSCEITCIDIPISNILTSETDPSLVLVPNGSGGVEFASPNVEPLNPTVNIACTE